MRDLVGVAGIMFVITGAIHDSPAVILVGIVVMLYAVGLKK